MNILEWGNVTRHRKTEQLGARLHLRAEGKWPARYHLDSHGLSSRAVAQRIDAIDEHHAAWVARLENSHTAQGTEFTIGDITYRVVDFTIPAFQPGTRCRVVVGVRAVEGDVLRRVKGFPRELWYNSLDAVPSNDAILAEVIQELTARSLDAAAHSSYIQKVAELRG